ncbi:MAG: transcription termination/antitermination protein NusG [Chloroflexi bacterium]|nr:MAG: transcription termination/antitermination protein NusG [Chloroflexota bacterium]
MVGTKGVGEKVLPEERKITLKEEEVSQAAKPEEQAQPQEESPEDKAAWYVIHSYSGYENKVKKNLEQRIESMGMKDYIFDVIVPTEDQLEIKDGQRRIVKRRIFPGYILVKMIMTEKSWYVVRNTPGVTGFVGIGNKPTPLSEEEVEKIMKRIHAKAPQIQISFRPGEKVRIIEGPFADFIGVVDEIFPDKGKVRILVSFFGRETPVELDFLQVEKA